MNISDFTIYDFICRNAKTNKDRDCLVFNGKRIGFYEYKTKVDHLAAGFAAQGLLRGDRVAVMAYNSADYMILYGAAAKTGAIVLTVNWRLQKDELEYILNDCSPKFIFAGASFQETTRSVLAKSDFSYKLFLIGEGDPCQGFMPLSTLYMKEGADAFFEVCADDGYVIIHTAAVEGRPRGALLSQSNLIHCNLLSILQYKLGKDDCCMGFLPLFHVAGLTQALSVMHAGGKNVITEKFLPEETLELIKQEKGTLIFTFAPILNTLLDTYETGDYDLSTLRNASGMEGPQTIERLRQCAPQCTFHVGFAQTEAMGVSRATYNEKPGSAGKPSILARVKLFDDTDQEVPTGEPGEICVRSPTVFLGYWGLENDTADTFRNGWHHTGDIGKFDEEGYLWYVKRKAQKELIKPGGENVYPAEVEAAILQHDAIMEVCVIGVRDRKWGEAIKAICVLRSGQHLSEKTLIEFVGTKIARYKKPQQVVFVDALPKNQAGGIDRDKVKQAHGGLYL
ncbi:MAG: AMP-binding protein [Proteobacteria bacterium]|nr:AMP-binding protein [Pseudomonadota bacterium]MBU1387231.1 AMP-binding protein [Pseudomonadota bacterium]MBU1543675.1 AMP-binding protein [Pseudomonadota bacterium]MBU2480027.1 AMP-binding protein [Pseudomonadota bacterium]